MPREGLQTWSWKPFCLKLCLTHLISRPETGCGVRLGGRASFIAISEMKDEDQSKLFSVTLWRREGKILDSPSSVCYRLCNSGQNCLAL